MIFGLRSERPGKSTAVRVLTTLMHPDAGHALLWPAGPTPLIALAGPRPRPAAPPVRIRGVLADAGKASIGGGGE